MYVDGLNFRRIARLLNVHHQTVINWVNAATESIPDTPPAPTTTETVELDELFTFIGEKTTLSMS
jgi:transposase